MANKKAQIGETMTWMVATIAIIVVLVISIYIASGLAISKKLIIYGKSERTTDLLLEKSLFAYFLSGEDPALLNKIGEQGYFVDVDSRLDEIRRNLK